MAKKKTIELTDDVLALISNIHFGELPYTKDMEMPTYGIDMNSVFGGMFMLTDIAYILGLYEVVIENIYAFHFLKLLPLLAGVLIGTFLTADLLERWMERYTKTVYLVIIGFVAGSMVSLMPANGISHPVIGILIFAAGFAGMYQLSKRA